MKAGRDATKQPTYGDVVYESARFVGVPAEAIDRFLGAMQACGWLLAPANTEAADAIKAAQVVSGLYFQIAEEAVGADEVRRRFKERFDRELSAPSEIAPQGGPHAWMRNEVLEEAAEVCEGERTHHPHRDNRVQDAVLTLAAAKIRALKNAATQPGSGSALTEPVGSPADAAVSCAVSARAATTWKRGEQRVVCAANRDASGRIVLGARHFDAVMMEQIKRSPDANAWRNAEQGFIDQFGKFLTREEARIVAEKQGQILEECGGNGIDLYSENLY